MISVQASLSLVLLNLLKCCRGKLVIVFLPSTSFKALDPYFILFVAKAYHAKTRFCQCFNLTTLSRRSTQNNRYKRPPSGASVQSFDVHKIAQRNEERLRRLENMQSGRSISASRRFQNYR